MASRSVLFFALSMFGEMVTCPSEGQYDRANCTQLMRQSTIFMILVRDSLGIRPHTATRFQENNRIRSHQAHTWGVASKSLRSLQTLPLRKARLHQLPSFTIKLMGRTNPSNSGGAKITVRFSQIHSPGLIGRFLKQSFVFGHTGEGA